MWGDATGMHHLYEALSAVCEGIGDGDGPLSFDEIAGSRSVDGCSVLLETVGQATGLEPDDIEPDVFHWRVDQEGWYSFQEQVEELTHCSPRRPGHQYLHCLADGEINVMVSCGEYPDDLKP
jgi:hypothetical protein